MSRKFFCGITLDWNYIHGYVDVSMPNFVQKTLKKLNYKTEKKRQLAPHEWSTPIYGQNRQFAKPSDDSPLLPPKQKTRG